MTKRHAAVVAIEVVVVAVEHTWGLQICVLVRPGHAKPPFAANGVTVRVCVCAPIPHVSEHASYALQRPTTQSTGQACVLHVVDSVADPAQYPPQSPMSLHIRMG